MRYGVLWVPAALLVGACCTIMHGSSQDIAIGSQPTGADVTVDNKPLGRTPVNAHLTRKDLHGIRINLAGYQPFEMNLTRHTSGWVWGNIVFGGLIGLAVDAITGGLYEIKPDQVMAQLQQGHALVSPRGDAIYVVLVQVPDSSWVRIGSLERVAP